MKKEYIIPRCHASLLHGQHLMLGVSAESDIYDEGNSDKSASFRNTGNFWSGASKDPGAASDKKNIWR